MLAMNCAANMHAPPSCKLPLTQTQVKKDLLSALRKDLSDKPRENQLHRARVLLCVTGSVAAIRSLRVFDLLQSIHCVSSVLIAATQPALHFLRSDPKFHAESCLCDDDEWISWNALGDPVLHIELRKWADVLVFAPLSANTLAKIAGGLCDNLVTSIARAWPMGRKPFIVAPAMNTEMWKHPITERQLDTLQQAEFGVTVVEPVSKKLACGDTGLGAMASPERIVEVVKQTISF